MRPDTKTKKQTGSRRYPFRGLTLDGAKHKAAYLNREIACVVPLKSAKCAGHKVEDTICLVRVKPNGNVYHFRTLSMPLLPCSHEI